MLLKCFGVTCPILPLFTFWKDFTASFKVDLGDFSFHVGGREEFYFRFAVKLFLNMVSTAGIISFTASLKASMLTFLMGG